MLKYHPRRPALHHEHADGVKLARLSLLVNIGDAAYWTILPIQLVELSGSEGSVGYYFTVVAAVGIVAALVSSAAFRRHRKVRIGAVSLALMVLLLAGMSLADDLLTFAAFDIPRSVAYLLLTIVLGLLVRDLATCADIAIREGRRYLYINIGWLIGPLLAGYLALWVSIEAVFLLISGLFAVALFYLWRLQQSQHPATTLEGGAAQGHQAVSDVLDFVREPRLRRVLALATGLELWWVISAIYIPLAVIDLGYGTDVVGWVITAGVVPLVALEVWVGKGAQRRGTRPYLVAGFVILGAGAASFAVLGFSPELLLFMFAAVNIGAALIEPLTETYFFELATVEEAERFFGIYNASAPLASLVGPLAGGIVFSIGFGLNGVWLVTALLLAACAHMSLRIRATY